MKFVRYCSIEYAEHSAWIASNNAKNLAAYNCEGVSEVTNSSAVDKKIHS